MIPSCTTIQEQLTAECGTGRPWSEPLESHLQGCEACAGIARRMRASVELVGALGPVPAPAELEGRVVSACQAGFSESRAVDRLRQLEPLNAPASLDAHMAASLAELRREGLFRQRPAPAELKERVDADLQDLPGSLSRKFVDKLPRLQVPGNLEERVGRGLEKGAPTRPSVRRTALVLAGMAAAAGLLWLPTSLGSGDLALPGEQPQASAPFAFEVVRPAELGGLSPRARELAARFSGGLDPTLEGLAPVPAHRAHGSRVAVVNRPVGSTTRVAVGQTRVVGRGSNTSSSVGGPGTGSLGAGGAQTGLRASPRFGPAYFADIAQAPFEVAYRGTREVTIRMRLLGMSSEVIYLEEVASDGHGAFTVIPRSMISPIMTQEALDLYFFRQGLRDGFFYRYRDFRIREQSLFWMNYEIQDLGQTQLIAGRACETFLIQRIDGGGNIFQVAIDPLTALVMQERCTGQDGELVSEMEFLSFDLAVDLQDLQLNNGQSLWVSVDQAGLLAVLDNEALIPSAPPTGYELQDLSYSTPAGAGGSRWAQLIYGDGVEQAFFLFEDSAANGSQHGSFAGLGNAAADVIRSYGFGPWNMLEGHIRGRSVLSVGRVSEGQLLLMLQSALE